MCFWVVVTIVLVVVAFHVILRSPKLETPTVQDVVTALAIKEPLVKGRLGGVWDAVWFGRNSHLSVSYESRQTQDWGVNTQHLTFDLPGKKTISFFFTDSQFGSCTIDYKNVTLTVVDRELATRILWAIQQNL